MTDDTDSVPGLAGTVRAAEHRIQDRFKATDATVDTADGGDVTVRLQFRGFTDLYSALARIGEVSRELNSEEETTEIHAGINTDGGYDPHAEETDDRPMGWVNATFELEGLPMTDPEIKEHPDGGETRHRDEVPPGTTEVIGDVIEVDLPNRVLTDGWSYAGITSPHLARTDSLAVDVVHAVQQREASGGGDFLYRRVTLTEENRVGPAEGGSPDHRELEGKPVFDLAGVATNHRDGPLIETAGVVMAEIGFQVREPRWYWEPIEHEAELKAEDELGGEQT